MKHRLKWDEKIGLVFFIISLGMIAVSLYLTMSSDIWYDELFTMGFTESSLKDMISLTARDVHPPLYYMIVSIFVKGAGKDLAARVMLAKTASVLPFLLCLFLAFWKIRSNFGFLAAGLFSFLLLSMPQMAAYTVEIRMYGYALFFIVAGMLCAYELAEREDKGKSSWIWLTICALAACYTHYFACVAACMIYVYLMVRFSMQRRMKREAKHFLVSGIICAACYLPWLLLVVTAQVGKVKENYWIQPVSLRTLGGCIKFIFKPSFGNEVLNTVLAVLAFVIFAGLILVMLISWRRKEGEEKKKSAFAAGCILVFGGIVLFGFLASVIIKPVFVYRYMMPAMGVFWLAFAIMAAAQKNKKYILIPLLLLITVIGLRNFRAFYGEEMWKRVQMKQTLAAMEQIDGEDIIIFNFDQTQAVVSYYLANDTYLWYGEPEELIQEMYPNNKALVEGEFSDEAGMEKIKAFLAEGKTVWFFGSGNARDEILEKWKEEGIVSGEISGVMLERYWFNIYQITMQED